MKKTFTFLFIALCGAAGFQARAQRPSANALLDLIRRHTAACGAAYAPEPAHKGTATGERLSAEADYGDDGMGNIILADSARFKYSHGRYSRFDHNQFQYISLYGLEYGTSPDFLYIEPKPDNYDSASLPHVAFDSLYHYTTDAGSGGGGLYLRHREGTVLFNADTAFTQIYNDQYDPSGNFQNSFGERILYNAAGRITKVTATDGGATIALRTITYNGAGNVTVDSLLADNGAGLSLSALTYYTYDASGRYLIKSVLRDLGAGSLDTVTRTTNTYYANGQLRTVVYEDIYNTGSLAPAYKDTFGYTPGVLGVTSIGEDVYDATGGIDFSYSLRTQHVTAGKKDSVIIALGLGGSPLMDFFSLGIHLNASGNPVSATQYDLQGGAPGVISAFNNWYYEPISPTGVKPDAAAAGISIAPNPTTGTITLHYADSKAGTPVTVRVMNMTGQLVQSASLVLQGTKQQIVLGSKAVPGQYLISVQDAGGNIICSQKIVTE